MVGSLRERIPEVFQKAGANFSREHLDEIRLLLLREKDSDEAHKEREGVYEALWLIVADPLYRGDLTLDDL